MSRWLTSIFQKSSNLKVRKTNSVDLLRSVGCFCIVWYHSNYYWNLTQPDRSQIDNIKLSLISWAMPFFYTSSFFYALKYGFNRVTRRYLCHKIVKLFLILTLTVGIYESIKFANSQLYGEKLHITGIPLNSESINQVMGSLFHLISTGGGTPAYFIYQLILMYPICYILGLLVRKYNQIGYLIIILLFYLGVKEISIFEAFTFRLSFYLGMALAGLLYSESRDKLRKYCNLLLIITLILVEQNQTGEQLLPILMMLIIFKFKLKEKWFVLLSEFGQKYSLFVFLFHSLVLNLIGECFNVLNGQFLIFNPSIFIYLAVNILGFLTTASVAIIIKRTSGYILTT